eukprot:3289529-Alexandrium_andersonii.AAC.1
MRGLSAGQAARGARAGTLQRAGQWQGGPPFWRRALAAIPRGCPQQVWERQCRLVGPQAGSVVSGTVYTGG